jgi:hypothetical protein
MDRFLYQLRRHRIALVVVLIVLASISTIQFLFLSGQVSGRAADIRLIANPLSTTSGSFVNVDVYLENVASNEAVSGVDIVITHSNLLSFSGSNFTSSVFNMEVKPPTKLSATRLSFSRVRFDTGYVGAQGMIGRLIFKANAAGSASIQVDAAATVVLAYTDAANILGQVTGTTVTIHGTGGSSSSSSKSSSSSVPASSSSSSRISSSSSSSSQASQAPASSSSSSNQGGVVYGDTGGNSGGAGGNSGGGGGGGGSRPRPPVTTGPTPSNGGQQTSSSETTYAAAPNVCDIEELPEITNSKTPYLSKLIENIRVVFQDVPLNAWFAKYVSYLMDSGIVSGYRDANGRPTGVFGSANSVTHAEITKMVLEASDPSLQVPASTTGQWFDPYFAIAQNRQWMLHTTRVINGNAPASRGAVARYIIDGFKFKLIGTPKQFPDLPFDHPFAAEIRILSALDILKGDDKTNTVRPDAPVNRAEVSAILVRALSTDCTPQSNSVSQNKGVSTQ